MEVSLSSSPSDRGSADDLRVAVPRSLTLSCFALAMFVFREQRWFVIARSPRRVQLDGLALVLFPLTDQPCSVVEIACDPDDVDGVEAFVAKLEPPVLNAEMRAHFAPFTKWGHAGRFASGNDDG